MVCFSYTIVNTLHKRDDKHDNNNNNYHFRCIFVHFEGGCLSVCPSSPATLCSQHLT